MLNHVFRVDVGFVKIDATVSDAGGRVVRDLTKEEFQVLIAACDRRVEARRLLSDLQMTARELEFRVR